ncbi:hypothetical protein BACCIP111899_02507 [Bacillus rhizoplanae]|uniref:Keratin n=1 Tax=Bacillus rhizoplanae TaxID=2880966 RepID=A0ABM8YC15_9BACI|nr:hypothetical protein [Bacillus rhizoplanae]CAG9613293.1 hypothetical protein BACCIP111899_02507 [Bacillus rhizoplanae]
MYSHQHYHTCRRYYGRVVRIEDYEGNIHIGKIVDITDESVWIEPVHRKRFDHGFGYGGGGGCDFCGGLGECNNCGFGFDGRRSGRSGRCDRCGFDECRCGFGGFGAVELGFGFIFGIALAALFFI